MSEDYETFNRLNPDCHNSNFDRGRQITDNIMRSAYQPENVLGALRARTLAAPMSKTYGDVRDPRRPTSNWDWGKTPSDPSAAPFSVRPQERETPAERERREGIAARKRGGETGLPDIGPVDGAIYGGGADYRYGEPVKPIKPEWQPAKTRFEVAVGQRLGQQGRGRDT